MTRQRNVYPKREIAHLWAHQTQSSARNPQGNFYFEGNTIYSYGRHFPIARIVSPGVVFLTSRLSSSTTAGHICTVYRAIPNTWIQFAVYDPLESTKLQWDRIKRNLAESRTRYENATGKVQKCITYAAFLNCRQDTIAFAEQFGFAYKRICRLPVGHNQMVAMIADRNAAQEKRNEANDVRRREKHRRWQEQNAELSAKQKADEEAQHAKDLETLTADIAEWRANGRHFRLIDKQPTMCRIDGSEVETSLGARFPVEHALRVLHVVERILQRGEEWQTNGHSIHLGHYQIDRIDADGTLHAGCHVVRKDELLRLIDDLREWEPRLKFTSGLPIEPASNWRA